MEQRRARSTVLVGLLVALLPVGAAASAGPEPAPPAPTAAAEVVTRLRDPRIVEASSIVVRSSAQQRAYIANDRGNDPRVFAVDLRNGSTIGSTVLRGIDVLDPEAMAATGKGRLWVGDVGNNALFRTTVTLYELPFPGRGGRTYRPEGVVARYPDGRHDAEALLAHPSSGARWVVTKDVAGGIYRIPDAADGTGVATMNRVRGVSLIKTVTDGVVLAGGRGVVLRGYHNAALYDLPSWRWLGTFALPDHPRGEAIAQQGTGRSLLVTSEGQYPRVLRTKIPQPLWRRL